MGYVLALAKRRHEKIQTVDSVDKYWHSVEKGRNWVFLRVQEHNLLSEYENS